MLLTEERGKETELFRVSGQAPLFILDDISCQPSDWNKRLRSFRVRISASGLNWAGCALLGRAHGMFLGLFHEF